MSLNFEAGSDVLHAHFSRDRSCIIGYTENGYRIINCCPVTPLVSKNLCQFGFHSVDIYKRSNILVLSGNAGNVKFKQNVMYVFDDETEKTLQHYEYPSPLIRCCILDEFIVAILPKTTYVFNLKDGTLYDQYSTYSNPRGLCDIRQREDGPVFVVLGKKKGAITIWSKGKKTFGNVSQTITAHESELSSLCVSPDGKMVATASVKGSIIRVFSTYTGECLGEIRRGRTHAAIVNLEFDNSMQYLLCNTGTTIHVARCLAPESVRSSAASMHSMVRGEDASSVAESVTLAGGLFGRSFSLHYSNPDHSKSMVAVFGAEPDTLCVLTSKGLLQKLSIDAGSHLSLFQEDSVLHLK
ncbi:hypothetical protein WA538_001849 [Blastocystis sp. DL]